MCKQVTVCPGHISTTLYLWANTGKYVRFYFLPNRLFHLESSSFLVFKGFLFLHDFSNILHTFLRCGVQNVTKISAAFQQNYSLDFVQRHWGVQLQLSNISKRTPEFLPALNGHVNFQNVEVFGNEVR